MNKPLLLISSCVLLFAMLLSCATDKPQVPVDTSSIDKILQTEPSGKTLKSTDGSCQITVPENWSAETGLNKEAKIQAAMRMRNAFLVVFVDQKDKYGDIDLAGFAEGAHKKLTKRLTYPVGNSGTQATVGGLPAIQFELSGQAEGSTFTYYQTLVQGPNNFYEILAWTPKAQVDKNKYTFDQAIKSFKESTQ